jgi:RsiW-degrading membrane proteinase PrsW (M82 family)
MYQAPGYAQPPYRAPAPRGSSLPDPERGRRTAGLVLYMIGILLGLGLLYLFLIVPPFMVPEGPRMFEGMLIGAALAIPAGFVYMTIPRLLDRYDPEPFYALWACVLWGGIAACGFSVAVNSILGAVAAQAFGAGAGKLVAAVVSAPLFEEFFKGLGVLGVFYFLRREFDGVVDGIVYATFVALGFATVENIVYYADAAQQTEEWSLAGVFVLRGILSPWVHPTFTSMTGIGFGLARESNKPWLRVLGPIAGYGVAVFMHFVWNGSASLGMIAPELGAIWVLLLFPWAVFLFLYFIIIVVLVVRFGKIIRENLVDEVAIGTIDARELDLVCSAFGVLRARLRHGKKGEEFVRAAARLGLSKWHSVRAMKGRQYTVSMDFIGPLRARIAELKASL